MKYIDLHIHTSYSDGTFTPQEAVQHADKIGLSAISITDHDTTDALTLAIEESRKFNVEVIPGIELSAELGKSQKREVHILGYFINWKDTVFQETLSLFRNARKKRAETIISKLARFGIYLDTDFLKNTNAAASIGRLHFAKAMVKEKVVGNINDAFQKYLGFGKPAYVPKIRLKPDEAIKMILKIGGIPVLAHPYIGNYNNRNILKGLLNSGLKGIEAWHSKHPEDISAEIVKMAQELGLLVTGGSDCHGVIVDDGDAAMGNLKVPISILDRLKEYKKEVENI